MRNAKLVQAVQTFDVPEDNLRLQPLWEDSRAKGSMIGAWTPPGWYMTIDLALRATRA